MSQETRRLVALAVKAVESKKGEDIVILELDQSSGAFTDHFVICSGTNPRQIQAICDEVEKQLKDTAAARPNSIEGYNQAEWVLLDYVDFVVHIFSERARGFYNLERLWKSARRVTLADLAKKPAAAVTVKKLKRTTPLRKGKTRSTKGPQSRGRKQPSSRKKSASKKKRKR
ncbi:MAG TPA: ribosome silencing factor [Alphaproteobacteria bacterium]|nr:ribosome silencing factor [Alphaproteobacteria bacterium]